MNGSPNLLTAIVLAGWPLIAIALFAFLPARRALVLGFVIGWLFLPSGYYFNTPLVRFDKHAATSLGALIGVLMLDTPQLLSYRPKWLDLPMLLWCFAPFPAAITSGYLTPYDGLAGAATTFTIWGIPYLLGRVYLNDLVGLRGLAVWIFIAGLIYVPFCLYEAKMSPQLHFMTYGFFQHEFAQVVRMGGWRPMVYLQHGLAVGMMMTAASLCGIWLWRSGTLPKLGKMPVGLPLAVLLLTTIYLRSAGALVFLFVGPAVLFLTWRMRTYLLVYVMCAVPVGYMLARSVGGWKGDNVVAAVQRYFGDERAQSMEFRFNNETLLLNRAAEHRAFGWGLTGKFLIMKDDGTIESVPDGLWVIAVGTTGLFGLFSLYGALLLPVALLGRRIRAEAWGAALCVGPSVVAVLIALHAIDNLINAMINPLFVLALGGLTGLV